jgi:flagellar motor switch protein FliG
MAIKNHTISVAVEPRDGSIKAADIVNGHKSLDEQVAAYLEKLHFSQVRDIIAQSIPIQGDALVLSRTIVYTAEIVAQGFEPRVAPKT